MEDCAQNRLAIAEGFRKCRQMILALGDETRQQVIMTLLESGRVGLRVGEITAKTHLSRPAVSHHLKAVSYTHLDVYKRQALCLHLRGQSPSSGGGADLPVPPPLDVYKRQDRR